MLRWTDLPQIPPGYGPSVVTLGNFDGVHNGHRAVLSTTVDRARAEGAHAVAVTFEPHPLAVLHPERAPLIITSSDQRLDLLAGTGLDAVLVMEFTREFALWTPERFVVEVFVEALSGRGDDLWCPLRVQDSDRVRLEGDRDCLRDIGAR